MSAQDHLSSLQFGYHGTHAELSRGDLIEPGHPSNHGGPPEDHVYFATRHDVGSRWAHSAVSRRADTGLADEGQEQPHTYLVQPTGRSERDPEGVWSYDEDLTKYDRRSAHPLRVVREVGDQY